MKIDNELKELLRQKGFNLFGISSIAVYNNSVNDIFKISKEFPDSGSIIIFGSGGKYFWQVFTQFRNSEAGLFLRESENPIDDYTEFIVQKVSGRFQNLLENIAFPFKMEAINLDYQQLAVCAGIGHLSPYIKLVLNPEFGPWVSLRGALLTKLALQPTGPLTESAPCTDCLRPCLKACPVNAVSNNFFDFGKCAGYRDLEIDCLSHCHVRKACIMGPDHAYSQEEGVHRNKSSLKTLRNYFNIEKGPES